MCILRTHSISSIAIHVLFCCALMLCICSLCLPYISLHYAVLFLMSSKVISYTDIPLSSNIFLDSPIIDICFCYCDVGFQNKFNSICDIHQGTILGPVLFICDIPQGTILGPVLFICDIPQGTILGPVLFICDIPQGTILGPVLFIHYINDICNVSNIFNFILFADDATIPRTHKDTKLLYEQVNNEIDKLQN